MLASLKSHLGDLSRIQRIVKTLGMVNAVAEFEKHPEVINGFSQLFVDLLGEEAGKGTRSTVGMSSLPRGVVVEVEAVFLVSYFMTPAGAEGVRGFRRYSAAIGFHNFTKPNPLKSFTLAVANSVTPKARRARAVRVS